METLPLEILTTIASHDHHVWRGMLSVRHFAEYTLSENCRSYVLQVFGGAKKSVSGNTTLCGKLHSYFDQPAEIDSDGEQTWYRTGELHRGNDLPAVVCTDGYQRWHYYGKCHRENDLPAIIYPDGTQEWYRNDKVHRENDKPAVVNSDGSQMWYQNNKPHRDGGLPAVINLGETLEYWYHGERFDVVCEEESSEDE